MKSFGDGQSPSRLRVLVLMLLVLGGCAIHPPYQRPDVALPAAWQGAPTPGDAASVSPQSAWWEAFNDAGLNEIEQSVQEGNYSLKAAAGRIRQARAVTRIVAAEHFPFVSGSIGAARSSRLSGADGVNAFDAKVSAAYEPDLWGRVQNLDQSAEAGLAATQEAERAAALSLASDAAGLYFQLAALNQRIQLARNSITLGERIDAVIQTRHRAGAVSGLDRAQSRTNLANIRAALPALLQARRETLNGLTILAGKPPGALALNPPPLDRVALPERLQVGLPSDLLQRRPDIRLAELNLIAAHADIGVARANLFPALKLTAAGGFTSGQLTDLLKSSSSFLDLGAALLAPIFQGGRLRAEVERARGRHEELLQLYRQTILEALRDVENALVALEQLGEQEKEQQEASTEANRAFALAELRYRSGLTDTLNLLTAQNTWLNTQNAVVQTRFARVNAMVSLYKALGGGW